MGSRRCWFVRDRLGPQRLDSVVRARESDLVPHDLVRVARESTRMELGDPQREVSGAGLVQRNVVELEETDVTRRGFAVDAEAEQLHATTGHEQRQRSIDHRRRDDAIVTLGARRDETTYAGSSRSSAPVRIRKGSCSGTAAVHRGSVPFCRREALASCQCVPETVRWHAVSKIMKSCNSGMLDPMTW